MDLVRVSLKHYLHPGRDFARSTLCSDNSYLASLKITRNISEMSLDRLQGFMVRDSSEVFGYLLANNAEFVFGNMKRCRTLSKSIFSVHPNQFRLIRLLT